METRPQTRTELLALLRSDANDAIKLLRYNGIDNQTLSNYSSPIIDFVFSEQPHMEFHKKYGRLEYFDIDPQAITKLVMGIVNLLEKIHANDTALNLLRKTLNRELLAPLYQDKFQGFFKRQKCSEKLEKCYDRLIKQNHFLNHKMF